MYIFLDESGNFTKHNHEEYFVIGSFTVGDPKRTSKDFRAFYKKHFPRKMKNQAEIKWSATGISDKLRLKTLKFISKLDVRIRYIYLLRNNIPAEYRKEDKFKDGLLYTNVVGELLEMYLPTTDPDFRLFCDQRRLSGMTKKQFKEILRARILPNLNKDTIVQIETVDSVTNTNIQIADWISGALARYLEKGRVGSECFEILKGNIIGEGKELFNTLTIYD
ncbi:MAG: DUF3800 domain-containing protein [Patescibacteria group bacterium]